MAVLADAEDQGEEACPDVVVVVVVVAAGADKRKASKGNARHVRSNGTEMSACWSRHR